MTKRLKVLLFTLGGLLAIVAGKHLVNNTIKPTSNQELARVSVKVTRMDGRSGGSGVILHSDKNGSTVLTNAHVCGVVKNGGRLTTNTKSALVTSYKLSRMHDLCLISTKENLGVSTEVATFPPSPQDEAIVAGHPELSPTIVTRGHFTDKVTVSVMTGIRPCTEEELNGDLSMVCVFLGGIPIVKIYDSQMTSCLISPGSSGSPVFNSSGEISGLVFAGSGDINFSYIVPQEYIRYFTEVEAKDAEELYPNMELSVEEMMGGSSKRNKIKDFIENCENNVETIPEAVQKICNSLQRSIVQ